MEKDVEEKWGCEFISNVIGLASVGINVIKIIGVHPLYVICIAVEATLSLQSASSKLKRV